MVLEEMELNTVEGYGVLRIEPGDWTTEFCTYLKGR